MDFTTMLALYNLSLYTPRQPLFILCITKIIITIFTINKLKIYQLKISVENYTSNNSQALIDSGEKYNIFLG